VSKQLNLIGLHPPESAGKLNEHMRVRTNSSQWAELLPKTPRR